MVSMGEHDELENRYLPRFQTLLSSNGVVIDYRRDRAGIDTGLHLFARDEEAAKQGSEDSNWHALPGRVWFQLKGIHAKTLTADQFATANRLSVRVGVEHLKFWFAAPEPVYLVVYVESVDTFIGHDVRDMVERQWGETFYATMRDRDGDVIVHVATDALMNPERISSLTKHRSMRIDGPAFRGRPLGHRLDPLRSTLACPMADQWTDVVTRILQAHDFRQVSRNQIGQLTIFRGTLAQTLIWQSPACAEYGYQDIDDVRDEPAPEHVFGDVCIILDAAKNRTAFSGEESDTASDSITSAVINGASVVVCFRGRDLSSTGGLWRSTARNSAVREQGARWHQLGLEALGFLVLTATLVYLEFAPELVWENAWYLD